MSFPTPHNYLTVHWVIAGVTETGQFGLRFDGAGPVSQTMVDDAAAAVSTFWSTSTARIPSSYHLSFLRLARIDTNGKYVPGTISYDHAYSPTVAGGAAELAQYPLQMATVCSLLTGQAHGLAHEGRIYIPPIVDVLGPTYQWTTAAINNTVNTLSAMLSTLSGSSLGTLSIFSKGNAAVPTGNKLPVTGVQLDTKPDTQRRRARGLVGTKGLVGTVS